MQYFLHLVDQLKKGDIAPVYLFYGPENYLRDQAVRRLRQHLLPPGAQEFDYHVLDGAAVAGGDIVSAAMFAPLVARRRLVVVQNTILFQAGNRGGEESVMEYLAEPGTGTCLVFNTGQGVDRRRKIFKEVSRLGRAVECTRLKPAELTGWLAKLAGEEGCTMRRDAAEELLARCGRDMYTLYNEMKKLTCYAGPGSVVGPDMVRELAAPQVEENIFEVVDAIGGRDCQRALSGIRNLLLQKQQPQQIIGMVARQFRLIFNMRESVDVGLSREEIMAELKLHPFVYKKIFQQRNNFPPGQLVEIINSLTELDYNIKTGRVFFYPAMETLVLKLCAGK